MSEYIQVTALNTEFQWPTRDNSGVPANSRTGTMPTGNAGLARAIKTTIKGIQLATGGGVSHDACIVSFYAHDGTTLLRSINTPQISATNMRINISSCEFTVLGGFSVTTDSASTVNFFVEYDPVMPPI